MSKKKPKTIVKKPKTLVRKLWTLEHKGKFVGVGDLYFPPVLIFPTKRDAIISSISDESAVRIRITVEAI